MGLDDYGDVFLSPESAIQAVLDASAIEDDVFTLDDADDILDDVEDLGDEDFAALARD